MEIHYNVYGCFRPPEEDLNLAKKASDAGFEGLWIGDHFHPWISSRDYSHHPLAYLSAAGNALPDIPLGISVSCPLYRYNPPVFTQAISTIQRMGGNRIHLGVGVGEAVNEMSFINDWEGWETRSERLIEVLEIVEGLLENDSYFDYNGEHYQYSDIKLHTSPASASKIETHWAAWGPKSCRLAGIHADNLISIGPPAMFENKILPQYRNGLKETNRTIDDVDLTTELTVNFGDPSELVREIRNKGEYIPDKTELNNPDPTDIQEVAFERLENLSDKDLREQNTITEDPEVVIDKIEAYRRAGVSRIIVGSNCGDPNHTIEIFENKILPYI
jgi:G6PDH family F420-dependent oxidoreductase